MGGDVTLAGEGTRGRSICDAMWGGSSIAWGRRHTPENADRLEDTEKNRVEGQSGPHRGGRGHGEALGPWGSQHLRRSAEKHSRAKLRDRLHRRAIARIWARYSS